MITLKQLLAFEQAYDYCLKSHPKHDGKHGYWHSIAEGLRAALDGDSTLKGEELALVDELQEQHRIKDVSADYDRDAAILAAYLSKAE